MNKMRKIIFNTNKLTNYKYNLNGILSYGNNLFLKIMKQYYRSKLNTGFEQQYFYTYILSSINRMVRGAQ